MTSALSSVPDDQYLSFVPDIVVARRRCFIRVQRAYPRSPNICVQYGCWKSQSFGGQFRISRTHTPANTLVMSRIRIPARGRGGADGLAAVAILRTVLLAGPLSRHWRLAKLEAASRDRKQCILVRCRDKIWPSPVLHSASRKINS